MINSTLLATFFDCLKVSLDGTDKDKREMVVAGEGTCVALALR